MTEPAIKKHSEITGADRIRWEWIDITILSDSEPVYVRGKERKAAGVEWTKDTPTKEGYYWTRCKVGMGTTLCDIVEISQTFDYRLEVLTFSDDPAIRIGDDTYKGFEWYGPLEPPA